MAERIVELIRDQLGKHRTFLALKTKDPEEEGRVSYELTFDVAEAVITEYSLKYKGKQLKKELHQYAKDIYKEGRRDLWRNYHYRHQKRARAKMDFSKLIIEAFKQLPKA